MAIHDDIAALRGQLSRLRGSEQARTEALKETPDLALSLYLLSVECGLAIHLLDPEGKATEGKTFCLSKTTITARVLQPGEELPDEFK